MKEVSARHSVGVEAEWELFLLSKGFYLGWVLRGRICLQNSVGKGWWKRKSKGKIMAKEA